MGIKLRAHDANIPRAARSLSQKTFPKTFFCTAPNRTATSTLVRLSFAGRPHQMHVVHVVRQFRPAVGGLENVVWELACAQVKCGHTVRVVTLDRLFGVERGERLPAREWMRSEERRVGKECRSRWSPSA